VGQDTNWLTTGSRRNRDAQERGSFGILLAASPPPAVHIMSFTPAKLTESARRDAKKMFSSTNETTDAAFDVGSCGPCGEK